MSEFEEVFKQRHLDWKHYYEKARIDSANSSGQWFFSISDVLADDLQDYDSSIRNFYKKCKKEGMPINDIYLKFAESKKDSEYIIIKIEN